LTGKTDEPKDDVELQSEFEGNKDVMDPVMSCDTELNEKTTKKQKYRVRKSHSALTESERRGRHRWLLSESEEKDNVQLPQGMISKRCRTVEKIPFIREGEQYLCSFCMKSFSSFIGLEYHVYNHTGDWPYKCAICDKHFFRSTLLKRHMECHENKELFICTRCKSEFTSWMEFRRHEYSEGDYKCTKCEKEYTNPESLKQHMRYHDNKGSLVCLICDKQLTSVAGLRGHLRLHTYRPEKKTTAVTDRDMFAPCGNTLSQSTELQSKNDNSTGKNFTCAECNQVFPSLDSLEDHMHEHCDDRPYNCQYRVSDDACWLVPIKQEQDVDPAGNDYTALNVTHSVYLLICFLFGFRFSSSSCTVVSYLSRVVLEASRIGENSHPYPSQSLGPIWMLLQI